MTVFAPFPRDIDDFGRGAPRFLSNLRVPDLDAQLGALRAAGIEVT